MRLLRHLFGLVKELICFARENKAWWILPIVFVLLVIAALIFTAQGSLPLIYSGF